MYKYEKAAIEKFGNRYTKNKINELIFVCSRCGKPKLYVNTSNGIYHCFRCDLKGRLRSRVSLSDIRDKYNLDTLNTRNGRDTDKVLTLIPIFKKPLTEEQIQALKHRGLSDADIKFYNICGRAEDNRIQIPNYMKGIFTDVICAWEYDKSKITNKNPKYLNSEGTPKSKTLFNIYNLDENINQIILCEGIFNAMTAGKNAVASYGCSLSDRQLELILDKKPKSILIAYDSDEPGVDGSLKVIKMLKNAKYQGIVKYILLPKGIDINDLGHDNFINYCNSHEVIIDLNSPISAKLPKLLFNSQC